MSDFDSELYYYYLDYAEALYERDKDNRLIEKFDKDNTFSAKDVIRIYTNNLTMEEKGHVKNFFVEIIPELVTTIANSNIWSEIGYDEHPTLENEVKAFTFITLYDLAYETVNLIYEIMDAIKDILTWDPYAMIRLFRLYERIIVLGNNWWKYLDKLNDTHLWGGTLKEINDVDPWWMF